VKQERAEPSARSGRRSQAAQPGMARDLLTARQAAERLGVKAATLYAYVSRGWIESVPGDSGRGRRYRREDVERLRARAQARRGGPAPGQHSLRASEPVLDSSITWLTDAGPMYRGHSAVDLARRGVAFEQVAELLWTGQLPEVVAPWKVRAPVGLGRAWRAAIPSGVAPLDRLAAALPLIAVRDPERTLWERERVLMRARATLRLLCAALVSDADKQILQKVHAADRVAEALALALGVRARAAHVAAIDRVLVLMADHELNASTFAARVAASTRADLYHCFGAGLAALSGPRHGLASEQVWALVAEIRRPERAAAVIKGRLRHGMRIPGFGHSVYRTEDPRVAPVLEAARALAPRSRVVRIVDAIAASMTEYAKVAPNVDLSLVALAGALRLEPRLTPVLMAIARVAGWAAHVIEQYDTELLVRPRARYFETQAD